MLDETRESLKVEGKKFNAKNREWDSLVNSIYEVSKQNPFLAYKKIDGIIAKKPQLDDFEIEELHYTKGDILFRNNNFEEAVKEFTKTGVDYPKSLGARAAAYLKLKQYQKCLSDLHKAAEINDNYLWHIGNYYEVINKKDSAIFFYNKLFQSNTNFYKYCGDRIKELENKNTEPFTELIFFEDPKASIIMPE